MWTLLHVATVAAVAVLGGLALGAAWRALTERGSGWPVLGCGVAAALPWALGCNLPALGWMVAVAFAGVWLGGREG